MLPTCRRTLDSHLDEYDEEWRVGITDSEQFAAHHGHFDVELLKQLAACRIEIRLARFEFAARELPQATVSLVNGPSTDQKAPVVLNYSGEYANRGVGQDGLGIEAERLTGLVRGADAAQYWRR